MSKLDNKLDREILALCQQVTQKAILPHFRNLAEGDIEDKGGNDPVTVADREAEVLLFEGLRKLDAGFALVGEEAAHADPKVLDRLGGDCWIVDPIDGTRNYAAGKPPFGIIIARARGGLVEDGWIYDCTTQRFCSAHVGTGAFVNGERIAARSTGETPPVAAISLLFSSPEDRKLLTRHVAPNYRLVDIPWCAAEQYPRLALGVNDVALFERTLAWDHAAGALWLNEAGGRALRPDGSPYRVDEPSRRRLIGAASPALWEAMAAQLADLPPTSVW